MRGYQRDAGGYLGAAGKNRAVSGYEMGYLEN